MRNRFIADGYAVLAIGYFGLPDTPAKLDRIALEGVRNAILDAARNPAIDARCIAMLVGSKGAELALPLAIRTPEIKAVPALMAGDKRKVFDTIMQDKAAVARARIPVEQINGPVFFLSATQDDLWASKEMSDDMMATLKEARFPHAHEHAAIEGGHGAPMRHLNLVRDFLNAKFLPQVNDGCRR